MSASSVSDSDGAFLRTILEILALDLQTLIDALQRIIATSDATEISIYSPRLDNSSTLELICSTSRSSGDRTLLGSERESSNIVDVSPSPHCLLFLRISNAPKNLLADDLFKLVVRTKLKEILNEKRNKLRHLVITQSTKSKDVNSFLHRTLQSVRSSFFFAGEMSIFLHERTFHRLVLSASTAHIKPFASNADARGDRLLKASIFYADIDSGNTARVFRNNRYLTEDGVTGFNREEFDRDLYQHRLVTRGYWPIGLFYSDAAEVNAKNVVPLGVFKVSNILRHNTDHDWPSSITSYDSYFYGFFCEVLFVLVQQYVQFIDSRTDYARLTHGINANIEASLKMGTIVRELLFDISDDTPPIAKFTWNKTDDKIDAIFRKSTELDYFLTDLNYFLEDLAFQAGKLSRENSEIHLEKIDSLHGDVLMPSVRLVRAIAAVNSKLEPQVSSLVDRGSRSLKPVMGSKEGLISVFRNLFENSIKYAIGRSRIDIEFGETDEHVVIDYFDNGIGIKSDERESIFIEGFRSVQARRLNNRGVGVGLNYSREVVTSLGGELECIEHVGGAHFRLKLRKAK